MKRKDIHQIIDLSLGKLFERTDALGFKVELTEKAKDFLTEKGYDEQYGARPLNRAIQKYLEDPIAEEMLKGDIGEGDTLEVDVNEETKELKINVLKGEKPAEAQASSEQES